MDQHVDRVGCIHETDEASQTTLDHEDNLEENTNETRLLDQSLQDYDFQGTDNMIERKLSCKTTETCEDNTEIYISDTKKTRIINIDNARNRSFQDKVMVDCA